MRHLLNRKALLSDSTTPALNRVPILGTITNIKGDIVATTKSDLWDGAVTNTIGYNEFSVAQPSGMHFWTGSTPNGDRYLSYNCSDWSSNSAGVSAYFGGPTQTNSNWFTWQNGACNNTKEITCLSSEFSVSNLTAFTGSSGTNSGDIDLNIDFPADTTGYNSVVIRRLTSGASAGNLDCSAGTAIQTYTSFTDTTLTDAIGVADTYYSYLACIYNSSSQLLTAKPLLSIKSKGTTPTHQIFASSLLTTGNLGGISGADSSCQTYATAAGFSGTWKAVISDSSTTAFQRIPILGKIYNIKGDLVANSKSDFWDSTIGNAVSFSEYGIANPSPNYSWAGTNPNGSRNLIANCSDWSSSSSGVNGYMGGTSSTNSQFILWQSIACNSVHHLYCISNEINNSEIVSFSGAEGTSSGDVDLTIDFPASTTGYDSVVIRRITGTTSAAGLSCTAGTAIQTLTSFSDTTITDATGVADTFYSYLACVYNSSSQLIYAKPLLGIKTKGVATTHRVFITTNTFDGNLGGLTGADAKCQTAANLSGLSGTWKAIMSDSSTDVNSRLTISGAVYKLDGTKIADDSADLRDGTISNTGYINLNEFGLTTSNAGTWTGSTGLGAKTANVCSDWGSNSNAVSGTYGSASNYTSIWLENNTNTCDTLRALYCVSQ